MAARIVLAVRESQYIEPLLQYVHYSEYGELLRITAFSRMDAFVEFMKQGEVPDAVVGDVSFVEAWLVEGKSNVPWAVLSEDEGYPGTNPARSGGVSIAKYQALPVLLGAILQLCEVKRARTNPAKGETLLLGIVSPNGSSGKTTVALSMAKQLGGLGLSVFYLNLESVDTSGLFLRMPAGHAPGMERLLYELKAGQDNREEVAVGLAPYMIRHDELRSTSLRPATNIKEMLQMTLQDTQDLLGLLAAEASYDVVIIDTGSMEEERTKAVLHSSGLLLWVLRSDEVSLHKAAKWLAHLSAPHSGMPPNLAAKSRFAVNCTAGSAEGRVPSEGIAFDYMLPYVPSWTQQRREELSLNSPPFQQEILQLCRGMIEPALPQVFTGTARYE
ncbi:hypothetical protein [Paenibacillus donghaensis]|uniref:hypothetical protein n=1 Tax=Paenibacillus donghaensis TaxID=414771 RepID=UPI0012FA0C13|nr:hypothetical protein [Paenibacillus donghaensis]